MNKLLSLLLACLALTCAAQDFLPEELTAHADSLYERGLHEKAASLYRQAADAGYEDAQFKLGYAYYAGEGVPRDITTAVTYFKRAAHQGHPLAEYNLAYCYMYGRGVPRDYEKAISLIKMSAENGYGQACLTLAECYEKGILVAPDEEEAAIWRQMAALANGEEVPEDASPTPSPKNEADNDARLKPQSEPRPAEATEPKPEPEPATPQLAPGSIIIKDGKVIKIGAADESKAAPAEQPAKDTIPAPEAPEATERPTEASAAAPQVSILYPQDQTPFHTDNIKLRYHLRAAGLERETQVVVMVDGVKQPTTRAVRAADIVEVELPDHDCTIILYAQNKNGFSEPASIRMVREHISHEEARLFAVAVGVSDYQRFDETLPDLRFTLKDANDFANAVRAKEGKPFASVEVKVLTDSLATIDEINEALLWLKQEVTPTDVAMFFYAGHGVCDEKDRFYFVPYGGVADKPYKCFSASTFNERASDIDGKFICFLDACYSGAVGMRSQSGNFAEQLRRTRNGMLIYASSAADTKSKEDENWKNGAFTRALIEAFNGAAREEGDQGLNTDQLNTYLSRTVRRLTEGRQKPVFFNHNGIESFNLFLYE